MLEKIDFETVEFKELDDMFIQEFGTGAKTEQVNGYNIQKSLTRFTSNSRKNSDWQVAYIITNPAGQTRKLEKDSV